jgi:Tol biopolymer transport system component
VSRSRLSLLLVLAVFLLALSASASASAEEIAYNCEEDLCLVDPANPTEYSRLTETATNERNPVWAPNGGLIAYNGFYPRVGNETWDVYTINPAEIDPDNPVLGEGTAVSETGEFNEEERVDWSPDSTLLAFTSRPRDSANPLQGQALVGRADGAADPVAIGSSNAGEGGPHFGPNSSTVVFIREGALYTAPANGTGTPAPLSIGAYGDDWSPDGRYLAGFRSSPYPYGLEITAVDGSGTHELPVPIDSSSQLAWSCDSSRIAYVADEQPLDHVRVAPVDGSGPGVQIPLPEGYVAPLGLDLSSDGTRVAFSAGPAAGGYRQVFVAPADGSGKPVRVGSASENAGEPSWKPGPACAAPVPPPANPPAGAGTAAAAGAAGAATIPATKTPVRLKLAYFKRPTFQLPHFMTIAGINCHAEGAHPTGKVAEICAAAASAYTSGNLTQSNRAARAATSKAKQILFARGKVKVPVGKSKNLKLRFTAAGMKLLKPGQTLTLTVKMETRQGSARPVKSTKTLKVKVPAKK